MRRLRIHSATTTLRYYSLRSRVPPSRRRAAIQLWTERAPRWGRRSCAHSRLPLFGRAQLVLRNPASVREERVRHGGGCGEHEAHSKGADHASRWEQAKMRACGALHGNVADRSAFLAPGKRAARNLQAAVPGGLVGIQLVRRCAPCAAEADCVLEALQPPHHLLAVRARRELPRELQARGSRPRGRRSPCWEEAQEGAMKEQFENTPLITPHRARAAEVEQFRRHPTTAEEGGWVGQRPA